MSRRAITALAAAIVAAGVVTGAVLVLSGGEDDSGFSVRPAAVPPLETEPVAQTESLALRGDGLAAVRFGEAAPAVLGRLRDLLGIPTEDEAIPCDGAQRRWVRWADLSIVLERGRFVAWTSGIHFPPGPQPLDLATPEGLAAGDAVSVLGEAYGGTVTLTREPGRYEGEQWEFRAVTPSGPISGVIEGDRAAGRVVAVSAGAQCRTAGR